MPQFSAVKSLSNKLLPLAGQLVLMLFLLTVITSLLDLWRGRQVQGAALPDQALTAINGDAVNLANLSPSLSVLYVWASWCGPCKVTTPAIGKLQNDYPVVSVALRSGDDQTVLQEASTHLKTTTVLNDPEGELASSLGIYVTPSIVFMKDGKIVGFASGVSTYWGLWLRAKWFEFRTS